MFTIPKQIVLPVGEYSALSDILKLSTDNLKAHIVKYMNFKGADVKDGKVFLRKASAPVLAKYQLAGLGTSGDSMRLVVDVTLNNQNLADFARANTIYKGKPLSIEFPGGMSAADATAFFNRQILGSSFERYVTFKVNSTNVDLEVKNGSVELTDCAVQKYDAAAFEYIAIAAPKTELGAPGFGTYEYIIENLHLPTMPNVNPWSEIGWGMPVQGMKYDQYTFAVTTDRGPMGMGAVGQEVKSTLTYCVYVPQTSPFGTANTDLFKAELEKIITSKGTGLEGADVQLVVEEIIG